MTTKWGSVGTYTEITEYYPKLRYTRQYLVPVFSIAPKDTVPVTKLSEFGELSKARTEFDLYALGFGSHRSPSRRSPCGPRT